MNRDLSGRIGITLKSLRGRRDHLDERVTTDVLHREGPRLR
jgi:hypothetical protein